MSKHAFASRFTAGKIDADAGVIYGVSLATVGPARGHGVQCDATTLQQLRDCAATYQGGLKVKLTHQGDAGDIIGALRNLRIEGPKLLGDLHLLKSYERRAYIVELASTIPDTFGLSVSFSGPEEEVGGLRCARCTEIYSCDLVAEPAANPSGLFSANVDARRESIAMTPEEILTKAKSEVAASLSTFAAQLNRIEEAMKSLAPTTELSALKGEVTKLSAGLIDDAKRTELVARTVAEQFARHTGNSRGVSTDGGGTGGTGAGSNAEPDAITKFSALAAKHFKTTNSKVKAVKLAMEEAPEAYAAFRDSGKSIKWAA